MSFYIILIGNIIIKENYKKFYFLFYSPHYLYCVIFKMTTHYDVYRVREKGGHKCVICQILKYLKYFR